VSGKGKSLEPLVRRLGYAFSDPGLLRRAVTHSSARTSRSVVRDNERLEFLGDRVLGLCVAEMLMEAFPHEAEGDLARRFNQLVRKEMCATIADDDWHLGGSMIMSGGEALSGGRRKITILGNACEAVLGAIYLDGGYTAARDVVQRYWEPRLRETEAVPTDAKTALQEWAQGKGLPLPSYTVTERKGPDHAPLFEVRAEVAGREATLGEGASKRMAEQEAARTMLIREKVWPEPHDND